MKFWFSRSETPAQKPEAAPKPAPQPAPTPKPTAKAEPAAPQPAPTPEPSVPPPAAEAAPKPEAAAPQPPPTPQPEPAAQQTAPQPEPAPATPNAAPTQASSQQLYRNLMDALYDSVLLVDEKGYVVDCNARVEHTFGYTTNDMWDMPLHTLIKGFGPIILAQISEPLSEGRPVIISGRGVRKDGTLFDAEISVSKVKLLRSDTLLFAVRDITKRIAALKEKALAQAKTAAPVRVAGHARVLRCAQKAPATKA